MSPSLPPPLPLDPSNPPFRLLAALVPIDTDSIASSGNCQRDNVIYSRPMLSGLTKFQLCPETFRVNNLTGATERTPATRAIAVSISRSSTAPPKIQPVPQVDLQRFMGDYFQDIGMIATGVMIAVLPVIVVYAFFSEKLIQGMTAGAVK